MGDTGLITLNGTENNYIFIEPYPGENPIIDSSDFNITSGRAPIMLENSSYVNISGLEIRNSNAFGANLWNSDYITFSNNVLHNISFQAIIGSGNGMIIENNQVYFAAMANYMNPAKYSNGGWPGVIMAWRRGPENLKSFNWTIRNNYVHDCWGEGIIGTFDGGVIQGNIVHDTWSVNIYLDGGLGASNLLVDSNFVYSTNATYNRNGYPAIGIEWSTEMYPFTTYPAVNFIISNNLIYQTGCGLAYWHDSSNTDKTASTYSNVSFLYNVIWEPYWGAVNIATVPDGYVQPENCLFWNNIVSNPSANVGNLDAWDFTHNNWVQGFPKGINETYSFSANPEFIKPSVIAGAVGFQLASNSSSIAKGKPTPLVKTDYWRNLRSGVSPTLGIYEPEV